MRSFSIVVAIDSQYGIGKNGGLAWRLPADLKHFKEVTCYHVHPAKRNAVIMGRKTWESLPEKFKPLPDRLNIVLTRDPNFSVPPDVLKHVSLEEALAAIPREVEGVFVIGGAQVYKEAIDHPSCQKLYVTHLKGDFACDAFFPPISKQFFPISGSEELEEGGINFQFCEYLRYT